MVSRSLPAADEFANALKAHASLYEAALSQGNIDAFQVYYEQIAAWNPRLHLVAPCSPSEFATRHVLESLLALPHIPVAARMIDVGSGAGLPVIPCLIVRPDLRATLIEASLKKSVFLRETLRLVGRHTAASVIRNRFESTPREQADVVTCRALDRFEEMFGKLLAWSPPQSRLLLFGGTALREKIERAGLTFRSVRAPLSEQRYLFIIERGKVDARC